MLDSLKISGFRAFKEYTVENLSRVNLFVGRNNSGKTTILEAAEILLAADSVPVVIGSATRRGEVYLQKEQDRPGRYVDVSHLFHGHSTEMGATFQIAGVQNGSPVWLECRVEAEESQGVQPPLPFRGDERAYQDERSLEPILSFLIHRGPNKEPYILPMSLSGAISLDVVRRLGTRVVPAESPVSFVRTEALDTAELQEFWDAIALTEEEGSIVESLRILEPRIERIAFLSSRSYPRYGPSSGGIYIRLEGVDKRIPLGSLGDGMRHLLTLSLAVSHASHGFVMVDEIDTGLHHSVMADMWRVLIATAERLDVQVFATTHSLDCVRSLASLFNREPHLASLVRLHRVDSERPSTVVYGPDEISIAAEQRMELRG